MVHRDSFHVPLTLALLAATLVTPLSLAVTLFSVPADLPGKLAVVTVGGVAQGTASFVVLYRPVSKLRADTREVIVQILLDELRRDYEETFDTDVELRASVMVLEKPFSEGLLPRRRTRFQIDYHSGDFGGAELNSQYAPGEGCWGRAFARSDPTYYDEDQNPHPARELTATQRLVTDHVTSAVSVPVYRPGAVGDEAIGILTLDSPESIDLTKFNESDAHRLVMNYAGHAGYVLQ